MPRTVVITGGTNGIGRGVALAELEAGSNVIAIGSDEAKGAALAGEAAATAGTLTFVRADLSSLAGARAATGAVREAVGAIDAVVFCANRQYLRRSENEEGIERTFSLYYLSRFVLGDGLADRLQAAQAGVIVNVAGPGMTKGSIHWADPMLRDNYRSISAQLQAGRANDLLGVGFAAAHPSLAYVLYHPGFTRTGFTGIPQPMRALLGLAARARARSVSESAAPVSDLIRRPPGPGLSAFDGRNPVDLTLSTFDPEAAARLLAVTEEILGRHQGA